MATTESRKTHLLRPVETPKAKPAIEAKAPAAHGQFPRVRLRRNRADDWTRRLVAENRLTVDDLLWPAFVHDREGREDVPSMPGVARLSISELVDAVGAAAELGIPAVALFPVVPRERKSEAAEEACNPDNLCNRAVRAVKKAVGDVGVICDVALDPYTSHGHDGLLVDGEVDNDRTVEVLVRQALNQAEAGCDILAPSDMMDGRIGAIRDALEANGFTQTQLLAYAAKYGSSFYGP